METETLIHSLSQKYKINSFSGESFWNLCLNLNIGGQNYEVKYIQKIYDLKKFGEGLSERSKDMFCPYPWDNPDKAMLAFRESIKHHRGKRDLTYLLFDKNNPIGFFFLWSIGNKNGLKIPELGEGIVDSYQGRGLGGFVLDMLTEIANILRADAVELTTDLTNEKAKRLYESRGYELLGTIKNPLEIDQTKDISELKMVGKFREEYHMAKIFRKREKVLAYLRQKREKQNKLFP